MALEVEVHQNVVVRIINLPLVSSTYNMVSSAYVNTKDNHPYLKSVCDVAEKGVKTITSVAMVGAVPILQKLEPQIAVANSVACVGLDKIEEKLPILYQPSDKVVHNASELVAGAKETLINGITGMVDKTKGAVNGSVAMTKAVVNGSINTVLGSGVAQQVSSTVDTALTKTESLLESYLPETEEETEAKNTKGFEVATEKPNYYSRLGSLSTKARKRVYQRALTRVVEAKTKSQETIAQLNNTLDLIALASQKFHGAEDRIYSTIQEWRKGSDEHAEDESQSAEQSELHILTIGRNLTKTLQTTCQSLLSNMQTYNIFSTTIVQKAEYVAATAKTLYQTFHNSQMYGNMTQLVSSSKLRLREIKYSMDDMMDLVVNNTPLNWLVGPFYPQVSGSHHGEQGDGAGTPEQDGTEMNTCNKSHSS
ncbi:perilipin-2 isoform X1 [Pelobates fuscus]|uniref:perilipin-2 isoform X1 n=1 Tax=Pelobates fuscus TaxID=191477 RepID=UPI002FE4EF33